MDEPRENIRVALPPNRANQVDLRKLGDQVHREFATVPAVNSYRANLPVQEGPDFGQPVPLLAREHLLEAVEITVGVGKVVEVDCCLGHAAPLRKLLLSNLPQGRVSSQWWLLRQLRQKEPWGGGGPPPPPLFRVGARDSIRS